jgi:hypothetical protein
LAPALVACRLAHVVLPEELVECGARVIDRGENPAEVIEAVGIAGIVYVKPSVVLPLLIPMTWVIIELG